MELLGDILSYHQSYSADLPHSSQVQHRMAYAGTAIFTVKLLQTILPPEKVCVWFRFHICYYFSGTPWTVRNWSFYSRTGWWQSSWKHCSSCFPPVLGHIIGLFITQHSGDSSSLLGAGELRQPWPLYESDSRCPLDGIHLQFPQGGTRWGMTTF